MPDTKDHQDKHEESRPFLASTDAHQATLMKGTKKHQGGASTKEDDPAPLLPPIMSHAADQIDANAGPEENLPAQAAVPAEATTTASAEPEQPDEDILHASQAEARSYYPNSSRVVAGIVASLAILVGFSAVWYNANQDVYTLGDSRGAQADNNQAKVTQTKPQATQPSTLGAETGASQSAELSFKNLPALAQGNYWLWIRQGDVTTSLGKFTINDQGQPVTVDNQAFTPSLKNVQGEATLLVSIETSDNPDQPSPSILLQGVIKNNKATLRFTAIDLSQARGVYTIAAPTDLSGDFQSSGIWFAKTDGHTLTGPGLSVPTTPEGWKYEAQLSYKDQIIATGRFSNPNDRDDFGVFTPNPDHIPNFPGEDYLQGAPSRLGIDFPANLTSGEWKVIISIEPDINGSDPTGDGTFFLQPFTATIAENTENYKEQLLTLDLSKFPVATIALK